MKRLLHHGDTFFILASDHGNVIVHVVTVIVVSSFVVSVGEHEIHHVRVGRDVQLNFHALFALDKNLSHGEFESLFVRPSVPAPHDKHALRPFERRVIGIIEQLHDFACLQLTRLCEKYMLLLLERHRLRLRLCLRFRLISLVLLDLISLLFCVSSSRNFLKSLQN